jgi:hypothetical protein
LAAALAGGAALAYGLAYLHPVVAGSTAGLAQLVGVPVLGTISVAFPQRHRAGVRREGVRMAFAACCLVAAFGVAVVLSQRGYRLTLHSTSQTADKLRRAEAAAATPKTPAARTGGVTPLLHSIVPPSPPVDETRRVISADHEHWRAAGYLPERGAEQRVAEQLRRIKRPLIEKAIAGTGEARLIMVTSALPGDGKTFTSINLALSMARERALG